MPVRQGHQIAPERLCLPAVRKGSAFPAGRPSLDFFYYFSFVARKGEAFPHSIAAEPHSAFRLIPGTADAIN